MRERIGGSIAQLFFKLTKTKGICLPWCTYYKRQPDLYLRLHELCHYKQMQREGVLLFILKYAFQLRLEWAKRPYEIEAENFAFIKEKERILRIEYAVLTDNEYIEYLLGE
jgi:hypothetical protein